METVINLLNGLLKMNGSTMIVKRLKGKILVRATKVQEVVESHEPT